MNINSLLGPEFERNRSGTPPSWLGACQVIRQVLTKNTQSQFIKNEIPGNCNIRVFVERGRAFFEEKKKPLPGNRDTVDRVWENTQTNRLFPKSFLNSFYPRDLKPYAS